MRNLRLRPLRKQRSYSPVLIKKGTEMSAKTVTWTSQKGGSGKTSSLMCVCGDLVDRGFRVLVGDTDEQQTAFRWAHCAEKPFPATVVSLVETKEDVYEKVSEQLENFDFILLDTSPSTTSPIVHACLLLSDVAIVPVQPAPPDIWSALATASLIAGVQKANPRLRARILANRVQRTSLSRMVLGAMSDFGIPMMRSRLTARVAYQEAALAGGSLALLGNGAKAAREEVTAVVDEFLEIVGDEK